MTYDFLHVHSGFKMSIQMPSIDGGESAICTLEWFVTGMRQHVTIEPVIPVG